MQVVFRVQVKTQFGEEVFLTGILQEGAEANTSEVKMNLEGDGWWTCEMIGMSEKEIAYRYIIRDQEGRVFEEFGGRRKVTLKEKSHAFIHDFWRYPDAEENCLYTAPFYQAFFKRKSNTKARKNRNKKSASATQIQMTMRAPRVGSGYHLGVLGNVPELGQWDEEKVVLLKDENYPIWRLNLNVQNTNEPIAYKYVIVQKESNRILTWEEGANRVLQLPDKGKGSFTLVQSDEYFRYPVGEWKGAGMAIPVFSIRSEHGAGVGEFTDIPKLVDWANATNLKLLQILPINDTVASHTWRDSYPYAAISVHALHPMYANMQAIGTLKDKKRQRSIDKEAKRLNELPELDYEGVMNLKSKFFKYHFDENKLSILNSKELNVFIQSNINWIIAYAGFSFLRDKYKTVDFRRWGEWASVDDARLGALTDPKHPDYDDVAIHFYIQYHLHKQLKLATEYARERGVVLKGDLPIGIYRFSVDAWRWPHLFNMETQTGAPPDDFSLVGQNWGFPTYNWEAMSANNYQWWTSRLEKLAEYFDVFRIDHILGFFRIWEMPIDQVQGLMGRFNPCIPYSAEDIKQLGVNWGESRLCDPYITAALITDLFGENTEWIFDNCVQKTDSERYELKPEFSSQRAIEKLLNDLIKQSSEKKEFFDSIRKNLYRLPTEVIFLRDPDREGMYNPRISLQNTYSFQQLDDQTKAILHRLHNDYFYHRHNEFWRESAMRKLPVLKAATDMLICGEDLGMVPASVPGVMRDLQLLSLAVQRMPNDEREFWQPADIPYMYVTSTSSHDVSNLREWWLEDREATQRFYNYVLHFHGEAPQECEPWVAYEIVRQHMCSPAMWSIFTIQDLLALSECLRRKNPLEERINIPANVPHYWRYRLHISIEELLKADRFNQNLAQLVDSSGRYADY